MKRFFLVFLCIGASQGDCVWERKVDFAKYPALLIDLNTNLSILPKVINGKDAISVCDNKKILLACPGKRSKIIGTKTDVVEATCTGDNKLKIGTESYSMKNLGCTKRIKEQIYDEKLKDCTICSKNYQYNSIGFKLDENRFYDMIYFRFNKSNENVIVTVHLLRGESIEASDGNPSRPGFKSDSDFFSGSPNKFYKQKSQKSFSPLKNYIDIKKQNYFARGHMAPDADFTTEHEADATYQYVNVVPQWQSFNNGNWKYMEMAVRDLAKKLNSNFHIWTGPSAGVLSLQDENNNDVDIYLGMADKKKRRKIVPAPKFTWKVVYEPSTDRGVAIIGENNPYLTSFPVNTICPDICDQIKWIDFDTKILEKGAMYCCSISDFVKNFEFLQKERFVNAKLLTE